MNDDFFVGFAKMPAKVAAFTRGLTLVLLLGTPVLASIVALIHTPYASARSDFRDIRSFEGLLLAEPVPHIAIPRPFSNTVSRYFLVGRGKYGPKPEILAMAGHWVRLRGSLIYRDGMTLVAVKGSEKIEPPPAAPPTDSLSEGKLIGDFTVSGEIVDSKCYFGTMRPGGSKVHRGCAVRCIAGGVPPVLKSKDPEGGPVYFFLVSESGKPVNQDVLDFVAEPVEMTGEVRKFSDIFVLYADPSTYRRT